MKPHAEPEKKPQEEPVLPAGSLVAAVVAVAATYAYFLIFAQFGFLHALTAVLGEGHTFLKPILTVMGVAGIAGSAMMVRISRGPVRQAPMTAGFLLAGGAAGLTSVAREPALFFAAAALTGLGTGMITAGLAGRLRGATGGARLGRCVGIGTGLAYAICNLPPVFNAGPQTQALLGIIAVSAGWLALRELDWHESPSFALGPDYTTRGMAVWTGVLLTLVTLDSAAFYHIQHNPALKAATWSGTTALLLNAIAHLLAGALAGLALDWGWVARSALFATLSLILALGLIYGEYGGWGAPLYAAGVSVYSAMLVFYPARSGRVGLAAWVYAVAGWTGSALGIGLAEQVGPIPGWGLVLAPVTVVCLLRLCARPVR